MRKEINSMCLPVLRNFYLNYLVHLSVCNCISKTADRIFTTCHAMMFQNKSGLIKFNIPSKFLQPLCLNLYTNFCLHDLLHPYFARMRTGIHDHLTCAISSFSFAYGQCLLHPNVALLC